MELLNFQNLSHFRNIPSAENEKTMPRGEFGRRRRAASSNEEFKNLCENHKLRQALVLLSTNENEPNSVISSSSYGLLLKACSKKRALQDGRQVHADLIKRGFEFEGFLQTTLQNMYAECGSLDLARRVFDGSSDRGSIVAWNSMIGGYCRFGELQEALVLFCELMEEGLSPDQFTFSIIIEATERI
ncbi:pentatricopeptide repeat-containing protein, mitochondrial [Cinnamomum micranthum f. kanehirae]|uniref:Pentatricopeptide repeat-containing protein, mitochondrial n=1 Tax=Cinnamomum micranthum f. kanehirae TaxID=337451 RepID=A0A3S3QUK3_9MAGN|nr:pentatricopeptide repeat-containing protein, mitochondrial [Cinnamomum micranthum f. kanehirae]